MRYKTLYSAHIKRLIDIILGLCALVLFSPLLLLTAILVKINLGSPVIFKQPRPGKDEKIFHLYKFRSMTDEIDKDGRLLTDSERLTKFGRMLRSSSLDELPELLNIVKGDMSIVGPRPLSIYYLPHYPSRYRKRHDVRPGLTGLAQINGRNNLQWDDRFSLDVEYVENLSFMMDLIIIIKTALKTLNSTDISVRGTNEVKDYGPYCILKEESQKGTITKGMKTYSEIGSYFWLEKEYLKGKEENPAKWLPAVTDSCFTFSGRNAIDIALKDILKNKTIKKVYVPAYSCISMLQAFIDRGMRIEFYDVALESGRFTYQIPSVDDESIVLIMSYFGLDVTEAHKMIEKAHKKRAVVIEDITHSILRNNSASDLSDYVVASLRKFLATPTGGWLGKRGGELSHKPSISSEDVVKDKIAAMQEKYRYIVGETASKEEFLEAHADFENDLIHVDRMLEIDSTSLQIIKHADVEGIRNRRIKNAETLIDGLKDLKDVITIPSVDIRSDAPLYLPVFLNNEKRDNLREYLIKAGIYCPIHWPEIMGAPKSVRDTELSLICDQRYGENDMLEIVNNICEWYRTEAVG